MGKERKCLHSQHSGVMGRWLWPGGCGPDSRALMGDRPGCQKHEKNRAPLLFFHFLNFLMKIISI